ncbi:MAG: response regulator [Burkholderiales bacterium]|nr:response regulator [Burkholderiales bacterium]
MSKVPLIWVVDDDATIRKLLDEYLSGQGFNVRSYASATEAERWLQRIRPDLIVLDVMLKGGNGIDLCRRLRDMKDDIPIIMLTARGESVDKIEGFEAGADDYVTKPFEPRELTMRIQAVLRRRKAMPVGSPLPGGKVVHFGDYKLDLSNRTLRTGDRMIEITGAEFAVLAALATHPHQPMSRERLRELSQGPGASSDERNIDVQVYRLRKLIEPPGASIHIQTVWGVGYVFVPERDERTS